MAAANHMQISPTVFSAESKEVCNLKGFEFIVADQLVARELVLLFEQHEVDGEGISPAIIAVTRQQEQNSASKQEICDFDGILQFPMTYVEISAQLSVIMCAHCAFAQRYAAA